MEVISVIIYGFFHFEPLESKHTCKQTYLFHDVFLIKYSISFIFINMLLTGLVGFWAKVYELQIFKIIVYFHSQQACDWKQ